ncbi:MAG: NAD(P)/FAD-dependent oxidoreductase [Bryobacteraceae bacterium]|nr:NAD(P)/FAD-dependent oxidoreductase [Bryobacteraceae bacterium]
MAATEYDGILLGSGHNNLILQAYLGRAGLKTVCLERAPVCGGGLATVEDPRWPGFFHNTHSFYHRAITDMPWYRDLDLRRLGAEYIEPDLNVTMLLRDGDALEWWTEFDRTAESFARFSRNDAAALRRWRDEFVPILDRILKPESMSAPAPPEERAALLERTREGRRLLEVSRLSPLEFVTLEFEHPAIQAGLLFFNGLREVDLRLPGFGHHIPALLASRRKAQMCLGGSRALAKALEKAVQAGGGEIRLNATPRRIHVENGRAAGVETSDGGWVGARRFIVSGLNPVQTFLELIDPNCLPAQWRERAANFRFNLLAPLFALYVNLKAPPRYRAADTHPELRGAFMTILGLDHAAQFSEIVSCHEAGAIPPTVMWGSCPTRFDPSQAPAGFHTAFMWEKLPYRLRGDPRNWDSERELHARRMLDVWTEYAPNLREATLDWFAQSPLDTERALPNMREGDLLVGALSHGQTGYNRPFAGAGRYRGYISGLYLCGGSCHPGGNITGLPGYNCAQVILGDLELPADWAPERPKAAPAP